MRIVVTGAAGFIGGHLCRELLRAGHTVVACLMNEREKSALPYGVEPAVAGPIDGNTSWTHILKKDDVVIHLAARVHVMRDTALDPLAEFRSVNTHGTARLARQAAAIGVRRLVFMSTVGVNGNDSGEGAYTENDKPAPHNNYSLSKLEAETLLKEIGTETGLEIVILRAPLVYGPGNPGNFHSLLRVVAKKIPLPLASIRNRKSFLYVGNLVEALALCCTHPAAAGNTYLVGDAEVVSTPELIRELAAAAGRPLTLFPCPGILLRFAAGIFGRKGAVDSLLLSLVVSTERIRTELGWRPPFTFREGIAATVKWFAAERG